MRYYKLNCVVIAFVLVAFSTTARAQFQMLQNKFGSTYIFRDFYYNTIPLDSWANGNYAPYTSDILPPTTYNLADGNIVDASYHLSNAFSSQSTQASVSGSLSVGGPASASVFVDFGAEVTYHIDSGTGVFAEAYAPGFSGYVSAGDSVTVHYIHSSFLDGTFVGPVFGDLLHIDETQEIDGPGFFSSSAYYYSNEWPNYTQPSNGSGSTASVYVDW